MQWQRRGHLQIMTKWAPATLKVISKRAREITSTPLNIRPACELRGAPPLGSLWLLLARACVCLFVSKEGVVVSCEALGSTGPTGSRPDNRARLIIKQPARPGYYKSHSISVAGSGQFGPTRKTKTKHETWKTKLAGLQV